MKGDGLANHPTGRERLNSAFRKYGPKEANADQQLGPSSPLKKGTEGEPSFGANSKNRSASGTTGNKQSTEMFNDPMGAREPKLD